MGLFFALLEGERVSDALELVDAMAAEGGPTMGRGVSPVPEPNADWLDAQVLAATARYYVGAPREAWRRLRPLVDGAPALSFLRSAKAQIASARGWPRLADEETHIAVTLTPQIESTEIALAEAAFARKRYDEARRRSSTLVSLIPGDQGVERLRRSIRAHDAPELRLDSDTRSEYGDATESPGSGYDVRSALLAPPIGERYRLKAAYDFSQASPVEGIVRRTRYGAGIEADWPDASLDATFWINRGTLDRAGVRVAGRGSLATTCKWRALDRAIQLTRLCARPITGYPRMMPPAASAMPGIRRRSPPRLCGACGSAMATSGSRPAVFSRPASSNGMVSASSCGRNCGGVRTRGSMHRISIPAGAPPPT